MLTPNVHGSDAGTAHPESNTKAVARGHHALAQRIREQRQQGPNLHAMFNELHAALLADERTAAIAFELDGLHHDFTEVTL